MEPYLYSGISPMLGFLVGVVSGLGLVSQLLTRQSEHSSQR